MLSEQSSSQDTLTWGGTGFSETQRATWCWSLCLSFLRLCLDGVELGLLDDPSLCPSASLFLRHTDLGDMVLLSHRRTLLPVYLSTSVSSEGVAGKIPFRMRYIFWDLLYYNSPQEVTWKFTDSPQSLAWGTEPRQQRFKSLSINTPTELRGTHYMYEDLGSSSGTIYIHIHTMTNKMSLINFKHM